MASWHRYAFLKCYLLAPFWSGFVVILWTWMTRKDLWTRSDKCFKKTCNHLPRCSFQDMHMHKYKAPNIMSQFIEQELKVKKDAAILDVGSGTGLLGVQVNSSFRSLWSLRGSLWAWAVTINLAGIFQFLPPGGIKYPKYSCRHK